MKKLYSIPVFTLLLLFVSLSSFGQSKVTQDTIRVEGVCDMCKERIELALDLKGIKFAEWAPETKQLVLVYRNDKIREDEIRKTLAGIGHDNGDFKAKDEVYENLPFCCRYRDNLDAFHRDN